MDSPKPTSKALASQPTSRERAVIRNGNSRRVFLHTSWLAIGTVAIALQIVGCNAQVRQTEKTPVTFVSDYEPVEFTFPSGWYTNTKEHPFDLQVFSKSQDMNTGVFVFKQTDLEEGSTPADILEDQIADIAGKRNNFTRIGSPQSTDLPGKTITTIDCAGDQSANRFYYGFSLIEFHQEDAPFVVVLQIAFVDEWKKRKPTLQEILFSARHRTETPPTTSGDPPE